jgi:acyl-coenzyme A synthetase/AMP-(fatty) acid ligase
LQSNQEIWSLDCYSENIAFVQDNNTILSYSQLETECNAFADRVGSRCLIFSLCTNTMGSLVGYIGALNNKIVPVLLNSNLETSLLFSLIVQYQPSYIWAPKNSKVGDFDIVYENFDYVLYKTNFSNSYVLFDDLALLLSTSGTTGSRKFIRLSYKNIEANARSIAQYLELDQHETSITTLPMNYTYGLSIVNSHLYVGATILLTDEMIISKRFWEFFEENNATSFGGVPYTYELLDKLKILEKDIPSLKTITQSGGKLSVEMHEKFAKQCLNKGRKFVAMYGATEATARMTYLPYQMAVKKIGSVGIAIPDGKIYIVDENGNKINQPDQYGELIYIGDNVSLGYAEKGEELKDSDVNHGVLKTGDIAQMDSEGYVYIVGRKSRFLKIQGHRISLDEVEELIKKNINEVDCACSGKDNEMYIFIIDERKTQKVEQLLIAKLGIKPASFNMVILKKIPRNASGKISYSELNAHYKHK